MNKFFVDYVCFDGSYQNNTGVSTKILATSIKKAAVRIRREARLQYPNHIKVVIERVFPVRKSLKRNLVWSGRKTREFSPVRFYPRVWNH